MELLGIILSAIAAIAAVATLWFSVRTSKGNIHKRIKRKEEQIREIDNKLIPKYGLNRGTGGPYNVDLPNFEEQHHIASILRVSMTRFNSTTR